MIFAAFFVSFPRLFRRDRDRDKVYTCTRVRERGGVRKTRREGKGEGELSRRATWTYRSRFAPFSPFAESPSYPLALVVRSFSSPSPLSPAVPLTININLKSIEKVLWSPIVLASSVFETGVRRGTRTSVPTSAYVRGECECIGGIRGKPLPHILPMFLRWNRSSLSLLLLLFLLLLLPPRRFIRSLSTTKEFSIRNFTDRQTESSYIPYSVAITWLFMISSAIDNRIFPFWLTLL